MRRRDLLGWAGAALAASRPRAAPAQDAAAGVPRAVTREARIDLGIVALGTDPEVHFTIGNDGSAPLTMTPGRLAPGLRLVAIDSPIPPGVHGTVTVQVDTFATADTSEWTIPLVTNDPARNTVVLQLRADVRTYILVTPPTARFSYVQHEREGGTTHVVGAAGHPDFRVLRAESPWPFLDVSVSEAAAATRPEGTEGPLWHVTLTIRRTAAVGPLAGAVVVHTNHPLQPRAWLPVSGFVRPLIGVTPPEVALPSAGAPGHPAETTVIVTNFGEGPLDLTSVVTTLDGVSHAIEAVQAGRRWRIVLRVGTAAGSGPLDGQLVVRTSRDDVPGVVVPIRRR